jgi:hypothetical protein
VVTVIPTLASNLVLYERRNREVRGKNEGKREEVLRFYLHEEGIKTYEATR